MNLPVVELKCNDAFNLLTEKEKKYAYYLSKASWEGALICLEQCSKESPYIFNLFQKLFNTVTIEELYNNIFKKEDINLFLDYVCQFYSNMGNYNSFGDDKFCPELDINVFKTIFWTFLDVKKDKELLNQLNDYVNVIYSKPKSKLGFPPNEISNYYSDNITENEIKLIQKFMEEKGWSSYNTRLIKEDDKFIIKIASVNNNPVNQKKDNMIGCDNFNEITQGTYDYNGFKIIIKYGDFSELLEKVCSNLEYARLYCANNNQDKMLENYINCFKNGSLPSHINGSYIWTQDKSPNVESYIGFIESYRDPLGVRGEFEGFVAVVNKETSKKFNNLVENAPKFLKLLPWGEEYEKDKFLKPDFTSLEVISFGSSGVPSGINIPNYDSVRQNYGFKNVALSNVISSKDCNSRISYIDDIEQELFKKYHIPSFEIQVGLHELLGHGSGKLFDENYSNGKTYDSVFTDLASSMEECRAECVGMYLCYEKEILNIFGHNNEDVAYVNWISELRAGLMGLKYYHPDTDKWGQAHMQARYVILKVCLESKDKFIEIIEDDTNQDLLYIKVDRDKIKTSGIFVLGEFLKQLQIYKSTANSYDGRKFFKKYSEVDETMMRIREKIIKTSKPRPLMVQPNLKLISNEVQLITYSPDYNGIIQSFIDRY